MADSEAHKKGDRGMSLSTPKQDLNTEQDNTTRGFRRSRIGLFAAAGLALFVGLGASEAEARNDFANGFEDELGRIVAHSVANIGHAAVAVHYRDHGYHGRRHWKHRRHHRRAKHFNRHYRHKRAHHRGHRARKVVIHNHYEGCGHRDHFDRFDRRDRYDRRDRRDRRRDYDY